MAACDLVDAVVILRLGAAQDGPGHQAVLALVSAEEVERRTEAPLVGSPAQQTVVASTPSVIICDHRERPPLAGVAGWSSGRA